MEKNKPKRRRRSREEILDASAEIEERRLKASQKKIKKYEEAEEKKHTSKGVSVLTMPINRKRHSNVEGIRGMMAIVLEEHMANLSQALRDMRDTPSDYVDAVLKLSKMVVPAPRSEEEKKMQTAVSDAVARMFGKSEDSED